MWEASRKKRFPKLHSPVRVTAPVAKSRRWNVQAMPTAGAQAESAVLQLDVTAVPAWNLSSGLCLSPCAPWKLLHVLELWACAAAVMEVGTVFPSGGISVLLSNIFSLANTLCWKVQVTFPTKLLYHCIAWVCPGRVLPVQLASTFSSGQKVIFWHCAHNT